MKPRRRENLDFNNGLIKPVSLNVELCQVEISKMCDTCDLLFGNICINPTGKAFKVRKL